MSDEFLSRRQAADMLGVSDRTLDRVPDLPRIKLTPRRIVYRKSDLMAFVEARAKATLQAA